MLESYFKSEEEKAFVQREIAKITLCNEFANLFLEKGGIIDFRNEYSVICPDCGKEKQYDSFICTECDTEQYEQEVFQWFLVDSYLAQKLEEIGEPVLHTDSHTLWGRTCCGQAIELDGTFQEIYRKLGK